MPWHKGAESLEEQYRTLIIRLVDELKKKFRDRLVSVIVYGSTARGDFSKDSDIDVF